MSQEKTLFPQLVTKWFGSLVASIKETINGSKEDPTYLFKTMLKESYQTNLKWTSITVNGNNIAADLVSLDSELPIKKRDSIGKASGEIPKSGMILHLTESQMASIDVLIAQGATEATIVSKIFADTKKCITGVEEQIEFMFLTGLSNGVMLSEADHGIGVRADFGHPNKQKFGVKFKWDSTNATVGDDIENVLANASSEGVSLAYMLLDSAAFNVIRRSLQIRTLFAASLQISDTANIPVPSKKVARELILDEYGLTVMLIDRSIKFQKNGKDTSVKPWNPNTVAFLTSMEAGELQYGKTVEENHPVTGVEYSKANSYTLVSKFSQTNPVKEMTTSQALVIPVIDVDNLYLMDITEAQEVVEADTTTLGAVDNVITLWGDEFLKADVITNIKTLGVSCPSNIGDATLIAKVNQLSDANEDALKALLTGSTASSDAEITAITFTEISGTATINSGAATIAINVANGSDASALTPGTITISDDAVITPAFDTITDYSSPVVFSVVAEDRTIKVWTVTVTVL